MTPLNIPGVINGYKVDEKLWRSGQPDDSAWSLLAAAGCRVVIDLNNDNPAEIIYQSRLVKAAGMSYFSRPWSGILPPSTTTIKKLLHLLDDLLLGPGRNAPVLVHCTHGSDRTGTLCACWRIHADGWTFERAMQEAFTSLGTQGMHEFWYAAAVAHYAHEKAETVKTL